MIWASCPGPYFILRLRGKRGTRKPGVPRALWIPHGAEHSQGARIPHAGFLSGPFMSRTEALSHGGTSLPAESDALSAPGRVAPHPHPCPSLSFKGRAFPWDFAWMCFLCLTRFVSPALRNSGRYRLPHERVCITGAVWGPQYHPGDCTPLCHRFPPRVGRIYAQCRGNGPRLGPWHLTGRFRCGLYEAV